MGRELGCTAIHSCWSPVVPWVLQFFKPREFKAQSSPDTHILCKPRTAHRLAGWFMPLSIFPRHLCQVRTLLGPTNPPKSLRLSARKKILPPGFTQAAFDIHDAVYEGKVKLQDNDTWSCGCMAPSLQLPQQISQPFLL